MFIIWHARLVVYVSWSNRNRMKHTKHLEREKKRVSGGENEIEMNLPRISFSINCVLHKFRMNTKLYLLKLIWIWNPKCYWCCCCSCWFTDIALHSMRSSSFSWKTVRFIFHANKQCTVKRNSNFQFSPFGENLNSK